MGKLSRAARTASLVFSRNPLIRAGDRVMSAVVWAIAVLALAVVPIAFTVGSVVHTQRAESALAEQRARYQVPATLQEDAPATGSDAEDGIAKASWRSADGRLHTDGIAVPSGLHVGDTTAIWVDQSGAPVSQPRTLSSAAGDGAVIAVAVLSGAAIMLAGLHWLVRAVLMRRARKAWESQWRAIEPRWSGRMGREPA